MLIVTNDGTVIDTDECESKGCFEEEVIWNGYAMVGRCSFNAYEDSKQVLYPKGDRYYLAEFTVSGKSTFANLIGYEHATRWLLFNNHRNLPDNLKHIPKTYLL